MGALSEGFAAGRTVPGRMSAIGAALKQLLSMGFQSGQMEKEMAWKSGEAEKGRAGQMALTQEQGAQVRQTQVAGFEQKAAAAAMDFQEFGNILARVQDRFGPGVAQKVGSTLMSAGKKGEGQPSAAAGRVEPAGPPQGVGLGQAPLPVGGQPMGQPAMAAGAPYPAQEPPVTPAGPPPASEVFREFPEAQRTPEMRERFQAAFPERLGEAGRSPAEKQSALLSSMTTAIRQGVVTPDLIKLRVDAGELTPAQGSVLNKALSSFKSEQRAAIGGKVYLGIADEIERDIKKLRAEIDIRTTTFEKKDPAGKAEAVRRLKPQILSYTEAVDRLRSSYEQAGILDEALESHLGRMLEPIEKLTSAAHP